MLFARVPLFPTCSALLSVAFDLNFPPASCWFDKIDDDQYCFDLFNQGVECEFCQSSRILFQKFDFVELGQNQGNC